MKKFWIKKVYVQVPVYMGGENTVDLHSLHTLDRAAIERVIKVAQYVLAQKDAAGS